MEELSDELLVGGPLPTKMTVDECWSLATNAGRDNWMSESRRMLDKFRVLHLP